MKSYTLNDGEDFVVDIRGRAAFRVECCDCGLVHIVQPKVSRNRRKLTLKYYRDQETTDSLRLKDEKA